MFTLSIRAKWFAGSSITVFASGRETSSTRSEVLSRRTVASAMSAAVSSSQFEA